MARETFTYHMDWRCYRIAVLYTPDYFPALDDNQLPSAHIAVTVIDPPDAPLPISQTGYRSHWTHPAVVSAEGGPVAYVRAWLDHAAQSDAWKAIEAQGLQLSLL